MSRLANCNKSTKVIRALRRAGLQVHPGSRHTIVADAQGTFLSTVPNHRSLNVNTLRAIIKQCGLTEEEFIRLY
jgi:predicted RNA binding protein YcfA (HicA-like mRNA interferase family)